MRFGIPRLNRNRPLIRRDRRIKLPFVSQPIPEIEMSFRIPRLKTYCLSICGDRLIGSPDVAQCITEIVMRLRNVRVNGNRPPQQPHRIIIPTRLTGDHSQIEHRANMPCLPIQNLSIKPFRLWQPARLMVRNGGLKYLLDRELRHCRFGFYRACQSKNTRPN